ncbi:uncharacterized mitochondrial protein AtMg00810-like [Aristolochia californica]|uniref:uncharacterized mitochondrial protein AtMg00810-like n=1 Tax=Aristolochia californica TaxID=171875 RepID=UPI0035E32D9B
MDVKIAFLNGDLTEEVYIRPPPGLPHPAGYVGRLRRALYGLKHAPRAWFAKFSSSLICLGFVASNYDSAMFIRKTVVGHIVVLLYVDDMIVTGDDEAGIADLKQQLHSLFEMKDLGYLRYFLGIEVAYSPEGYILSQSKYISEVISREGLTDDRIMDSPIELNHRLGPTDGDLLSDVTRYREVVGSLVYLTVTRPDITHVVHVVSQFVSAPRTTHWTVVIRILLYLRGTVHHDLLLSSTSDLVLTSYSDADWAGDPTDRKSTTGYCIILGNSLVAWKSKKQSVVSRTSAEAEYQAMATIAAELIWFRRLLEELGFPQLSATPMFCDNQSAIQIAKNPVFHERSKYIKIDCHFMRHHYLQGSLTLPHVSSTSQLADVFTKSHTTPRFHHLIGKLILLAPSKV